MSAQTVYRFNTPVAQPGGIYDLAPYEVDSFTNEADNGVLKFGMGVVKGTKPGVQIKVPASGAAAADFEGVVTNRRTTENAMFGGVDIIKGATVGVMRYGNIWVQLADSETPEYGDDVYLVTTGADAGCFAKTSSSNVKIKAKFKSGAEDGIALIELFNQAQA